jgi:hypothetical protein
VQATNWSAGFDVITTDGAGMIRYARADRTVQRSKVVVCLGRRPRDPTRLVAGEEPSNRRIQSP